MKRELGPGVDCRWCAESANGKHSIVWGHEADCRRVLLGVRVFVPCRPRLTIIGRLRRLVGMSIGEEKS